MHLTSGVRNWRSVVGGLIAGFVDESARQRLPAGPATVTVTCTATDDLAGLVHAVVNFFSPLHGQFQQAVCFFDGSLSASTSATATFPQFSEAGAWTISVEIFDRLSNRASVDLAASGFPSTLM